MKDVHWWQQQKPFISHLSLVSKEPVAIAGPEPTTSRAGGIHANQLTTSANPFFTFSASAQAIFDHQTFLASLTFLESRMMSLDKRPVRGLGKERARVRECEREREKEGGRGGKSRSLLTDTNLRRHFNGWTSQERDIAA